MGNPKRARSWKRRIQPRVGLKAVEPVLYSTHNIGFTFLFLSTDLPASSFGKLSPGFWIPQYPADRVCDLLGKLVPEAFPLSANINETLTPFEFNVEGEEGIEHGNGGCYGVSHFGS